MEQVALENVHSNKQDAAQQMTHALMSLEANATLTTFSQDYSAAEQEAVQKNANTTATKPAVKITKCTGMTAAIIKKSLQTLPAIL